MRIVLVHRKLSVLERCPYNNNNNNNNNNRHLYSAVSTNCSKRCTIIW